MTIIEFITARLDEAGAAAKAAARAKQDGEEWHLDPDPEVWGIGFGTGILRTDGNSVAMAIGSYAADHIARHDPARVLRDIEAKRAIVHRYEEQLAKASENAMEEDRAWILWPVIAHIAAIDRNHPDFDPDWCP